MGNNGLKSYVMMGMGVVILVFIVTFWMGYNSLVSKEEQVMSSWSQVESNLQRKLDLLPNLVKVVQTYAKHEKELLSEITALRSNAHKVLNENQSVPNETQIMKVAKLQKSLDASFLKLFAVAENYPDLKSSEQFLQLQSQIEGTENRINITRMQFNNSVGIFNASMRRIPANIIASIGGFQRKAYFKAETQAHEKFELGL